MTPLTSLEILEAVQECPILRGKEKNECGMDCRECMGASPERAALCDFTEKGGLPVVTKLGTVYFYPLQGWRARIRQGLREVSP